MLTSLRRRNVALMAMVLIAAQAMTMALVAALVILPQADRVARIMANNVRMVAATLDSLGPDDRQAFIDRMNASGAIMIRPGDGEPPGTDGRPTLLETAVLRALATDLNQSGGAVWRGGGSAPLWVRLKLGRGGYYWLSLKPSPGWTPSGALLASVGIALVLSLTGGLLLQKRVNRPLKRLTEAIDAMPDRAPVAELAQSAPAEIAGVADAFNRMASRMAAQDADRAFMLAGISHDLKTPIAKLRLATAVSRDDQTAGLIERQFERLDRMLDQFLDFGRGNDSETRADVDVGATIASIIRTLDLAGVASIDGMDDTCAYVTPTGFERTIINLLRNAMVHGRPPISVYFDSDGKRTQIQIQDSGEGAPPALLDKLGQPFLRGDDARPSDGGVGLGIAIAARFAANNDGMITFENAPDGGFMVRLSLPAVKGLPFLAPLR